MNYYTYPNSIKENFSIVKKNGKKYFSTTNNNFSNLIEKNDDKYIYPLNWDNYLKLCEIYPYLKPTKCSKKASFGTGDRLGLVTCAHLNALKEYDLFPVISQQSPRELEKENRTFKSVLLDAVMGLLENGYDGPFGADADHIKSEDRLIEGIEAGYSMYTIDVSDELSEANLNLLNSLNQTSKDIINKYKNTKINAGCYSYIIDEKELTISAIVFQKSMEKAVKYNYIIGKKIKEFDLEISIDEGSRMTTFEDHLFCAAYLKSNKIDFFSIAPKFPGKFQKALDYVGNIDEFEKYAYIHASICNLFGDYKLSLHSGSDKFSVYPIYNKATNHYCHIKTSGTSYLRAIILTSKLNKELFYKIYNIAITNLDYNKKFYDVDIETSDFPKQLNNLDLEEFISDPKVTQLLHISYGSILDEIKNELYEFLDKYEEEHYKLVTNHIKKHLVLL